MERKHAPSPQSRRRHPDHRQQPDGHRPDEANTGLRASPARPRSVKGERLYEDIIAQVAARYEVPAADVAGACRQHTVAAARRVVMYLAYRVSLDLCSAIAARFGLAPATFSRAVAHVRREMLEDAELANWIVATEKALARRYAAQHLRPMRKTMPAAPSS